MSAPSEVGISVFTICVLVPVFLYALVKQIWNQPLHNGSGYFLGVEVPAGFYDGPGRRWMTSYHAMVAALYGVWAVALAAIVILRRWEMTPTWAGGFALAFVPAMLSFQAWTRHKLGANPPVRPVALALESRRFSDYISWPMEALAFALVAVSWWLMMRHGLPHHDWRSPLLLTWMALGLLPGKMAKVRASWPLPAERAEEHHRYQDAERRGWIRMSGLFFGWLQVIVLFGVALLQAASPGRPAPVWMWLVLTVFFAVWGYGVISMFRERRQLLEMGRDLRPAGSWRSPFGRLSSMGMSRAFLTWFAIWSSGILLLALYPLL
jgi:hypothetical protein